MTTHNYPQNYIQILEQREKIKNYFEENISLINSKKIKDKMKTMRTLFNFETIFGTESVQGTAGVVSIKPKKDYSNTLDKLVFKVSNCIDYSIEHESLSLDALNRLANYCPHFMYKFASIDLPVSSRFFKKPGKNGIFEDPDQYMLTPVLFTEYISKYTFYHAIKSYNKNIISSLLLQIFSALKISQQKCNFTHYDLHMDNILVREGDSNILHLYVYKDDELLVPTYGLTPVIIDMGSCHTNNQYRMFSNSDNYEHGLQPTSFDRLADIHHLLLSTFSCLERYTDIGKQLMFKIALMFSALPVWKEKGWKILFRQLDKELKELIKTSSKLLNTSGSKEDREDYQHLFSELYADFIPILNAAVPLPFKNMSSFKSDNDKFKKELLQKFDVFFKYFHTLINFNSIKSDQDCLYVFKEVVDCAYSFKSLRTQEEKDKAINKLLVRLKINNVKDTELRQLRINDMMKSITDLAPYISAFYMNLEDEHNQFLKEVYTKCPENLDCFIDFFRQNIPCEVDITSNHKILMFDSEKEKMTRISLKELDINSSELQALNKMSLRMKAKVLRKMIEKNEKI